MAGKILATLWHDDKKQTYCIDVAFSGKVLAPKMLTKILKPAL
jgi:hypothetical protein